MTQENKDKWIVRAVIGALVFNLVVLIVCEFNKGY